MTVPQAQADMREGYYGGAAGILASALAWSVAAGYAFFATPGHAIWALLVGGMLIHPVGLLICKLLGARGAHTKGNPLCLLAVLGAKAHYVALAGAALEWVFGLACLVQHRRR
ncbi:hypothetical protein [Arenimonas sp.]|uniref:DUF7010 family protein n=1 Tax=Arenimonas sp. TaxID=1872635 RepID=UPI0035B060F3